MLACSAHCEEPDHRWGGGPESLGEEFAVHPVNLTGLPKAFDFQEGSCRVG